MVLFFCFFFWVLGDFLYDKNSPKVSLFILLIFFNRIYVEKFVKVPLLARQRPALTGHRHVNSLQLSSFSGTIKENTPHFEVHLLVSSLRPGADFSRFRHVASSHDSFVEVCCFVLGSILERYKVNKAGF